MNLNQIYAQESNLKNACAYIEILMQLQIPIVLACEPNFLWKDVFLESAKAHDYIVDESESIIKNLDHESKKKLQFGEAVTHLFVVMESSYHSHKNIIEKLEQDINFHILGELAMSGLHLIMFDKDSILQKITQVQTTNWKPVFIDLFGEAGKASGIIPEFLEDAEGLDLSIFNS